MSRLAKQFIYLFFFLAIISLVLYGGYSLFTSEPTCFDGRMNGDETGIDCGGSCFQICLDTLADINITQSNLIPIENGDYDYVARVRNPNTTHGSGNVEYDVNFLDSSGTVVDTFSGAFNILPGQTRYVLISPIKLDREVTSAQMVIKNPNWIQVEDFDSSMVRFLDRRKEYVELGNDTVFSRVDGVIYNDSDFDFDFVEVMVVLFDSDDKILGAGSTTVRTFLSKTENFYQINWFEPFEGEVARMEVQATTNAFDNLNFLRTFGGGEQFQQF